MPVRPRRRQHRLALTLADYVDLVIGPPDDSATPFDRLHAIYHEHAIQFDSASWAFAFFETGHDDREPVEVGVLDSPGLPMGGNDG